MATKTKKTKTRTKTNLRYRLYLRPAKPPKWWPRKGRAYVYVGCLRESGWVVGDGDIMTREQVKLTQQILSWDFPKPIWHIERVPEVEYYEVILTAGLGCEARVRVLATDETDAARVAREIERTDMVIWSSRPARRQLRVASAKRNVGVDL